MMTLRDPINGADHIPFIIWGQPDVEGHSISVEFEANNACFALALAITLRANPCLVLPRSASTYAMKRMFFHVIANGLPLSTAMMSAKVRPNTEALGWIPFR